jgi:hypothetical protein
MTLEKRTNGNVTGTTNFAGHAARGKNVDDGEWGSGFREQPEAGNQAIRDQAPP